jgi:heat shock protein HspQ
MTEAEIHTLLEVQYLKGRIDELHKALPTITNLERKRKLDVRLDKYYHKLKDTDEIAYHLYQVEKVNRDHSKRKGIQEIQDLLNEIFDKVEDGILRIKIQEQLNKYHK